MKRFHGAARHTNCSWFRRDGLAMSHVSDFSRFDTGICSTNWMKSSNSSVLICHSFNRNESSRFLSRWLTWLDESRPIKYLPYNPWMREASLSFSRNDSLAKSRQFQFEINISVFFFESHWIEFMNFEFCFVQIVFHHYSNTKITQLIVGSFEIKLSSSQNTSIILLHPGFISTLYVWVASRFDRMDW